MAPRAKPPTPAEEAQHALEALTAVLAAFPGATAYGNLPYGEMTPRCAGMVMTQHGRQPCGNVVDPKRGSMCEDPRGCREAGRVNGYADRS